MLCWGQSKQATIVKKLERVALRIIQKHLCSRGCRFLFKLDADDQVPGSKFSELTVLEWKSVVTNKHPAQFLDMLENFPPWGEQRWALRQSYAQQ